MAQEALEFSDDDIEGIIYEGISKNIEKELLLLLVANNRSNPVFIMMNERYHDFINDAISKSIELNNTNILEILIQYCNDISSYLLEITNLDIDENKQITVADGILQKFNSLQYKFVGNNYNESSTVNILRVSKIKHNLDETTRINFILECVKKDKMMYLQVFSDSTIVQEIDFLKAWKIVLENNKGLYSNKHINKLKGYMKFKKYLQ